MSPYFKYFQLDFADGILVEDTTADLGDLMNEFESLKEPWLKGLSLDFHFMVKNYRREIEKLKKAKETITVNNIFIHFSAIDDFSNNPLEFPGFNVGLVLNPEDTVSGLMEKIDLHKVPYIQIMSVVPGAQGRPFIPETLNKIDQLRANNYRNKIYLDGAVNDKTIPIITSRKNLPDVVCPGSYLTKCPDEELENRRSYLLKFS